MIERGNPLWAATQEPRQVQEDVPFSGDRNEFFSWRSCWTWLNGDTRCRPWLSHMPGNEQSMLNELNIDVRILGLPHSVVDQAQNSRVCELVKKIENHPHRQSLQRDPQQNTAYNQLSATTKKMIQGVGNVQLFELFETDLKLQWKECQSYCSEGIVYCTWWHLLKEIVANWGFIQYTLVFSIPECVIKKGRLHGHGYGRTPEKKEYHLAHHLTERCIKKTFKRINDRLLRNYDFRECVLEHDRDGKVFFKMNDFADKDSFDFMTNPNIFDTSRIGGSLSVSLETLDHWETVLTSTKRCPH